MVQMERDSIWELMQNELLDLQEQVLVVLETHKLYSNLSRSC